ncbi:ORF27 [macacine gammaherpesvirus 12]|uniref:ORF27 n=1 Tax=macacine gammaherpesvirus 12 TaxID=2560571 RepID=A0A0B5D6E5_9GAMA|nr:ORF27 [Macaca nemestrina rhadinovirus 2]AJE29668.1 ORF27 [Macaca nemestrina rhadinovirus 2]
MSIPKIMTVSRDNEGTVCEVALDNERQRAMIYYPKTTGPADARTSQRTDAIKEAFDTETPVDIVKQIVKDGLEISGRNCVRLLLYFYCYLQFVCFALLITWQLNPHAGTPGLAFAINPLGPRHVSRLPHPTIVAVGCGTDAICKNCSVPDIQTELGTVYHNGSSDSGQRAHYGLALLKAAWLIMGNVCPEPLVRQAAGILGPWNETAWLDFKSAISATTFCGSRGVEWSPMREKYLCRPTWNDVINSSGFTNESLCPNIIRESENVILLHGAV